MSDETLSPLESAVLRMMFFGDHPTLIALRAQLEHLKVKSRKATGVGFFTDFTLDAAAVPAPVSAASIRFGDVITPATSGLQFGGGFLVFIDNGLLTMLEGYSYGLDWPRDMSDARVEYIDPARPDLRSLTG